MNTHMICKQMINERIWMHNKHQMARNPSSMCLEPANSASTGSDIASILQKTHMSIFNRTTISTLRHIVICPGALGALRICARKSPRDVHV